MQLLFGPHVYTMMKQLFVGVIMVLFILACANTTAPNDGPKSKINTMKLFRIHCVTCHGADGKLGDNGAKDLTQSPLTIRERIEIITNGKNVMTEFGTVLTKGEIEALAKYTLQLK